MPEQAVAFWRRQALQITRSNNNELTLLGAEAGCAAKVSTENLSRLPIRINRFAE